MNWLRRRTAWMCSAAPGACWLAVALRRLELTVEASRIGCDTAALSMAVLLGAKRA